MLNTVQFIWLYQVKEYKIKPLSLNISFIYVLLKTLVVLLVLIVREHAERASSE